MPDEQVGDEEFLDIAKTPEHARILRKSLQQLAEGGQNEVLREMAKEVLSGRTGLREAAGVTAYADALGDEMHRFSEKMHALTLEEREELAQQATAILEEQRSEAEAENERQR